MKLEREVLTMPEAFFDALKANGTTADDLRNVFNNIVSDFEKAVQNGDEPETALESAVEVFLADCGYNDACDSVKDFLGLDEDKRYYSI